MKFFVVLFATFLSLNTYADEKFICSLLRAKKTVEIVNAEISYDKAKHCAVSCILNLDCNATEVYLFGLGKELADLLGAGDPDGNDIKANRIGISASESGQAKSNEECLQYCQDYDWREL